MDEFEKIRAFSIELGRKTEEAVAIENKAAAEIPSKEEEGETPPESERADFLENWNTPNGNLGGSHRFSKGFWAVFSGITILLGCLIVVIYLLLKGPIENEEIITIAPTQKPVKVRPENPGGMVIPDQDKVIYSRLTQDTIPAKVEKLFPDEERPVMPPVIGENKETSVLLETETVKVIQGEPLSEEEGVKKNVSTTKKIEMKSAERIESENVKGDWKVQLFSSTDKVKVEKQWQIISKKHKALVSDMPVQIVPAQIAGKGTFYRLQVGAFETREMASNLCTKLKKQKQDCIPAK